MGLISASSLGKPIRQKSNNSLLVISTRKSDEFSCNKKRSNANAMAPALTSELSTEHHKRNLNSQLSNCQAKLDLPEEGPMQGPSSSPNGEEPPSSPTNQQQSTSDEEAALKAAADEVLGHNVDEILQVLESMETGGKCGGGSASGEDSMLRLLGSDLELLPDICGSQETEPEVPSPTPKVEDRVSDAAERQHLLERRCERLLRRVRKLQSRGTARHAAHQMQDLVTSARALLKARNASHRSHAASQQQANKEQLLDSENVKNMSAAALVNLVRKISAETTQVGQGLAQALSPDQATNLRDGAGALSFRLRHAETTFDSDVTASSSGGESCDEAAGYNPNHTGTLPICKRAAWRFSRERASVVSRWTWLQANISDLEYRIRQYSECHRQVRASKGAVRLEEPAHLKSLQGESSTVVNGCHSEAAPSPNVEEEASARTRPLDLTCFRKRKVVVPGVMLPKSGKRCFPPQNQPPCCRDSLSMPCVLCFSKRAAVVGGAQHPAPPTRDLLGGKESVKEKAARLDPAVHPVLSGAADVSRALHMAAHLRQPSWQQAQLRQRGLARLGLGLKRSKAVAAASALAGSGTVDMAGPQPARRKYTLHKKNNNVSANALTAKLRRKAKSRKRHRGRPANDVTDSFERYRRPRKIPRHSLDALSGADADAEGPAPSPGTSSELRAQRRKREDSYDIDNIVIPYSMAALTRVEKLEYKEILTPKWRVADVDVSRPASKSTLGKNGVVKQPGALASPDSEVEDITDEAMTARHDSLELEERKKFRCPINPRGMRGRRTDSRAESSGANTPDPMSPNTATNEESPLTSPRATPLPPAMLEDSQGSKPGKTSKQTLRRRTVSSQRASPEPNTTGSDIAPFEARLFPLSEESFQRMLSDQLPRSKVTTSVVTEESTSRMRSASPPPSPCGTDSTVSALAEDDDPEWTMEMVASPASSSSTVRATQ